MCNMLILVNDQGCQASCCRPFPRPSSPTAASGLAWLSPACFPPLPASTSCLQEGPALHCLWWCSGWQTIPGQWPWQTAACALLPAHLSLISSSQLVPLSFYSCCPGICWETQYCAAATGLLRPEVGSRVTCKLNKVKSRWCFIRSPQRICVWSSFHSHLHMGHIWRCKGHYKGQHEWQPEGTY